MVAKKIEDKKKQQNGFSQILFFQIQSNGNINPTKPSMCMVYILNSIKDFDFTPLHIFLNNQNIALKENHNFERSIYTPSKSYISKQNKRQNTLIMT